MCSRAEGLSLGRAVSAVHDYGSLLDTHIDFLSSSLNCCLNRGLLRAECVGQVEFSFHDPIRIVFLDGELRQLGMSGVLES
jgi:hypothetical protein